MLCYSSNRLVICRSSKFFNMVKSETLQKPAVSDKSAKLSNFELLRQKRKIPSSHNQNPSLSGNVTKVMVHTHASPSAILKDNNHTKPTASHVISALQTITGPFPDRKLTPEEEKYIAIDCEMVGVGLNGVRSALALVVAVDYLGRIVYLAYVKPREPVVDYRTEVSGIRPSDLLNAKEFTVVQRELHQITHGKIIVGHSLVNDFRALIWSPPGHLVRDTATYSKFSSAQRNGKVRSKKLKHLIEMYFHHQIQTGEHDPAEDARAAMALYKLARVEWEKSIPPPKERHHIKHK